jgi:hypothetical protein
MKPSPQRLDDLAHARWRVKFLRNLLEVHRSVLQRSSHDWLLQETDYVQRLIEAEKDLAQKSAVGVTSQPQQFGKRAMGTSLDISPHARAVKRA